MSAALLDAVVNPRRGLPSASSLQRYDRCKASLPWETRLRKAGKLPKDHGSDDSKRGDRIHDILKKIALNEQIDESGYEAEEVATARRLWREVEDLIIMTFGTVKTGLEFVVEERLWLKDVYGDEIASGQFDIIVINHLTKSALVVDYKSGWKEVADAKENWQIKFAVVMVNVVWGIEDVTGAIVHAKDGMDFASFVGNEIREALTGIDEIISRKNRNPFELGFTRSEYCEYCPALKCCPAIGMDLEDLKEITPMLMADASGTEVSEYGVKLEAIKHLVPAWESEVKYRISRGMRVPGWKLVTGAKKRVVLDQKGMANKLISIGVPVRDVMSAIKIPIGEAEELYQKTTGETGKMARKNFNELMDPFIEVRTPEPSLKRE